MKKHIPTSIPRGCAPPPRRAVDALEAARLVTADLTARVNRAIALKALVEYRKLPLRDPAEEARLDQAHKDADNARKITKRVLVSEGLKPAPL